MSYGILFEFHVIYISNLISRINLECHKKCLVGGFDSKIF